MSELSKLDFLLGRWKGISVDQFGEKGTLETTLECTHYPSEKFIQLSGESRKDGKILIAEWNSLAMTKSYRSTSTREFGRTVS